MTDPFETFWQEAWAPRRSPRGKMVKVGKAEARIEYAKARRLVSDEVLFEAARRYVEATDEAFIMDAFRWLKKRRWEDDIEDAEPEQPAAFRSYDTWSEKDKRDCADTVTSKGTETATGAYRYTHEQIARLRADGYLRPVQVA